MAQCIFCLGDVKPSAPPEHVLLDSLGGRFTVQGTVCSSCNHNLGGGPDRALAESVQDIRMLMSFKSGRRKAPPPVRHVQTQHGNVTLDSGGMPRLERPGAFEVDADIIQMRARDKRDLANYVRHLARRIKLSESETVEVLKRGRWQLRRAPIGPVTRHLGLGGTGPIRAMAKACLLLWQTRVGNAELHNGRYDDARRFVLSGSDNDNVRLSRMDTRPWPTEYSVAASYGDFANVIYVTSNSEGRVLGYFRLYGNLGWRVELAQAGGVPGLSVGLASNPERPAQHTNKLEREHPLTFEWIDGATYEGGFEVPRRAFAKMLQIQQSNAYRDEYMRIARGVLRRRGIAEDAQISVGETRSMLDEINFYFAGVLLRYPMTRTLGENEIRELLLRQDGD